MRTAFAIVAPLAIAGAAYAQPINENPPTRTIQCIEVGGRLIPAVCHVPGSRLDTREFICTCPAGGERVEVAICAEGQEPPPEGRALINARRQGLKDDHSLIGDTVDGRPICVAPRRP